MEAKKKLHPRMKKRFLLGGVLLLFLAINLYGIRWGLPSAERNNLYFTSEEQIKRQFLDFDQERVTESMTKGKGKSTLFYNPIRSYHPDESNFIKAVSNLNPLGIKLNPHLFFWGVLYIYILAFAFLVFGILGFLPLSVNLEYFFLNPEQIANFYLLGRLTNVFFGLATCFLIYKTAEKLYKNTAIGIFSSLLFTLYPLVAINTHQMYVDIPGIFFVVLSFYFALNIMEDDKKKWFIISGIFAGLAMNTKYPFVLIWLAVPVIFLIKHKKASFSPALLMLPFLSGLFVLLTFLLTNPWAILSANDFFTTFSDMAGVYIVSPVARHPILNNGILHYLYELFFAMCPVLFFLLLLSLFYIFLKERTSKNFILVFIICVFFLFFANAGFRVTRYLLPIFPFAAILTARGLGLMAMAQRRSLFFKVVPLITICLPYVLAFDKVMAEPNVRTVVGKWIKENIPCGKKIAFQREYQFILPPLNLEHYGTVEIFSENWQAADYVVINEFEEYESAGKRLKAVEDKFVLIKTFRIRPMVLGIIPINWDSSEVYGYLYPDYFIYKKKD
jgi:4-amino-4-deoxy-L-arabinose transferase-like glycosyltransferase